ncbi:Uncharacterised protein [Bordetella pertussis]|nr:Uncharacterised protein [Bordetella pertussis]CFO74071.1 Uncharacterised protein [Bordetella pertussis]CFP65237.1 Uncharacterised protein [Bordetella pertussis]CFW49046.1 Uncharacterised protein [Bordetella pertussis]CPM12841.1 Uncharacterised protein [Bordetella pertussis]
MAYCCTRASDLPPARSSLGLKRSYVRARLTGPFRYCRPVVSTRLFPAVAKLLSSSSVSSALNE